MADLIERYDISVLVFSSPEIVREIITDLEKIKIWEPSHRLPFVKHNWVPSEGKLSPGAVLVIKSLLWTFQAECKEVNRDGVRWEFIRGPLRGYEYWQIIPEGNKCRVLKVMDCNITGVLNKTMWKLIGRKVHDWASLRQLKSIKRIAES